MKSLKGIASFVSVASSGGFSAAAKLQGVSAVAVSKNVATLERQLGVRLFQRTTRTISLTEEGRIFYHQCEGPLRALQAAQVVVEHSSNALTGTVRVTSVSPIAMGYLVPLMPDFHASNPKIHIDLRLDDRLVDMVTQGVDVGIRVGQLPDSTLVARPIAAMPFVVCASPGYFKSRRVPVSLDDLADHNCIRLCLSGRKEPFPWFLLGMDSSREKTIRGNFSVNDFHAMLQAAVQGQGLACVPLPLVMPVFRAGLLWPLLTDHIDPKYMVYMHYPNRKNLPQRIRAYVDFILGRLEAEPDLHTPHHILISPFIKSFG